MYEFIFSINRNEHGLPLKVYFRGKPYHVHYVRNQGAELRYERITLKKLDDAIILSPCPGSYGLIIKRRIHKWFIQWYCKDFCLHGGGLSDSYGEDQ